MLWFHPVAGGKHNRRAFECQLVTASQSSMEQIDTRYIDRADIATEAIMYSTFNSGMGRSSHMPYWKPRRRLMILEGNDRQFKRQSDICTRRSRTCLRCR